MIIKNQKNSKCRLANSNVAPLATHTHTYKERETYIQNQILFSSRLSPAPRQLLISSFARIPRQRLQIQLQYANGRHCTLVTLENWKSFYVQNVTNDFRFNASWRRINMKTLSGETLKQHASIEYYELLSDSYFLESDWKLWKLFRLVKIDFITFL